MSELRLKAYLVEFRPAHQEYQRDYFEHKIGPGYTKGPILCFQVSGSSGFSTASQINKAIISAMSSGEIELVIHAEAEQEAAKE